MISNLKDCSCPPPPMPRSRRSRSASRSGAGDDVTLMLQLLDDFLDQLVEPLFRIFARLPVLAEQPFQRLFREQAAIEQAPP